MAYKFSLSTLQ